MLCHSMGLTRLIDHARPGDSLCATRLDRLGRSLKELLETVENLKANDIHLVGLEERIDPITANGELVFHVFGAIARVEKRLISEPTRDGIAAATKRGRRLGRPSLNRETVSAAQALVEAGLTAGRVAKQLGIEGGRQGRRQRRDSMARYRNQRPRECRKTCSIRTRDCTAAGDVP